MTELVTVYLGIGSNLGNREANLDRAIEMLSERMKVSKVSSVYDTEPQDNPNQPRFLNIVCEVSTYLTPEGLLVLAKGIESKMGRVSKTGQPRLYEQPFLLPLVPFSHLRDIKWPRSDNTHIAFQYVK